MPLASTYGKAMYSVIAARWYLTKYFNFNKIRNKFFRFMLHLFSFKDRVNFPPRVHHIHNFFYSLRSESRRISVYSHTPFIFIIHLYLLENTVFAQICIQTFDLMQNKYIICCEANIRFYIFSYWQIFASKYKIFVSKQKFAKPHIQVVRSLSVSFLSKKSLISS